MSEYDVRIERLANGYEVTLRDPKIVKENAKPNSKYRNSTREYVFKTLPELLAFLKKNLDKALPPDEFGSAFDSAVAAATGDD